MTSVPSTTPDVDVDAGSVGAGVDVDVVGSGVGVDVVGADTGAGVDVDVVGAGVGVDVVGADTIGNGEGAGAADDVEIVVGSMMKGVPCCWFATLTGNTDIGTS
jgi:hypothetical protein